MEKIWNVIVSLDMLGDYGRQLLRGLGNYSRLHRSLSFRLVSPKSFSAKEATLLWEEGLIDGIIAYVDDPKDAEKIFPPDIPRIAIPGQESISGIPNVEIDTSAIAKLASEHLLERGFENFAFAGAGGRFLSKTNGEKFAKLIAEAGYETKLHFSNIKFDKTWLKSRHLHLLNWLKSLPKPVGMLAYDDFLGRLIVETCRVADILVPEEIAVIGAASSELICNIANPPLSSVVINAEKAGYEAAELLTKIMAGEEKMDEQKISVNPRFVVTRQSTDILAVRDTEVAAALNYIRQNSDGVMQVPNVLSSVAVSRRVLERRFREVLGRSISSEIRRVNIDRAAQMLTETNLTVSQIALKLGYSDITHISRSFRKEKGTTPLAYRKKYGNK